MGRLLSDEDIKPIADLLSKQKPWQTPDENWFHARKALMQHRGWWIRFLGPHQRSGWDQLDIAAKLSVPLLISILSIVYAFFNSSKQEYLLKLQKESDVLTDYLKNMQPLLLEKGLKKATNNHQTIIIGRSLSIAALSQLQTDQAPAKRTVLMRFLLDSGVQSSTGFYSMPEVNLSYANLADVSLSGANFEGGNLSHIILRTSTLGGINISKAVMNNADLIAADLRNANLKDANLGGSRLQAAKLVKAQLNDTNLSQAKLGGADLSYANLSGANLSRADLTGANLERTILKNANLSGALLGGANLKCADLSSADLSGADLIASQEADLSGANLQLLKWNDQTKWPGRPSFKYTRNMPISLVKNFGGLRKAGFQC